MERSGETEQGDKGPAMGRQMSRGKQQVLLNYLPGRTFDFDKIGVIARVDHIRATPQPELNARLILNAVGEMASEWDEEHRPTFRDLERGIERFVLVEPRSVESVLFPLAFWCQNPRCGNVTVPRSGAPASDRCSVCRSGRLVQLRFVKIHRCGALEQLAPPPCSNCQTRRLMALDTRGSERISDFQWICRECGHTSGVFGGRCRSCNWPGPDPTIKNMSVEVHRAGRTFYPHQTVLLNQPGREVSALLNVDKWQAVAAASFLGLPEVAGRRLVELANLAGPGPIAVTGLTETERVGFRAKGMTDEAIAQFEAMQAQLQALRSQDAQPSGSQLVEDALVRQSGVQWGTWERAGFEMMEAVMPLQSGSAVSLFGGAAPTDATRESRRLATGLGLAAVDLAMDFPITTATFGYSRVDYHPNEARLNAFPADRDNGGRFPIFVDVVQADAILIRLDHNVVIRWLGANGHAPVLPSGLDQDVSARSYFVRLLDGTGLRAKIVNAQSRLVFGLLHTLSHAALRRASLLSGLEGTSLSEYILPRALTFALYCNHRFGATIGALTALFEQSLREWLADIWSARRCVYDPVCSGRGGSCHACTHVAETSCRFFNLNLARSFLFGGRDEIVGNIGVGFLDFAASEAGSGSGSV